MKFYSSAFIVFRTANIEFLSFIVLQPFSAYRCIHVGNKGLCDLKQVVWSCVVKRMKRTDDLPGASNYIFINIMQAIFSWTCPRE